MISRENETKEVLKERENGKKIALIKLIQDENHRVTLNPRFSKDDLIRLFCITPDDLEEILMLCQYVAPRAIATDVIIQESHCETIEEERRWYGVIARAARTFTYLKYIEIDDNVIASMIDETLDRELLSEERSQAWRLIHLYYEELCRRVTIIEEKYGYDRCVVLAMTKLE